MVKSTYLLIPMIPSLRNNGLERRKFLVRHRERPEEVLLQQRCAGERQEQRARECLSPKGLALREWRLVHRMYLRMRMWGELVWQDLLVLVLRPGMMSLTGLAVALTLAALPFCGLLAFV